MKLHLKIKTLLVFFLMFGSVSFSYAANKATACHDCSFGEAKIAARNQFNWNETGTVFVFDYINEKLRKFAVLIRYVQEGPDSYPYHVVVELNMSSTEYAAEDDLLEAFDELKKVSNKYGSVNSIKSSSSSKPYQMDEITMANVPNVHEFIRTSITRRNTFRMLFDNDFNSVVVVTKFNSTSNTIGTSLNFEKLKMGFKLIFADGSYITVIPDISSETFEMIKGTAIDLEGNTVPLNYNDLSGESFRFKNNSNFNTFREHVQNYGVDIPYQSCVETVVACIFNNTLTCWISDCAKL